MKTRRQQVAAAAESDDEAPEEVCMAQAKEQAVTKRREERALEQEQRRKAKEKRQARAKATAPAALSHSDADGIEAAAEATAVTARDDSQAGAAVPSSLDLLPDDVVAALTAREKNKPALQRAQQLEADRQAKSVQHQREKKRRKLVTERDLGVVTVKVLTDTSAARPSEPALQFAREKLFGSKRRSQDMLAPVRIPGSGTFHYRPAIVFT